MMPLTPLDALRAMAARNPFCTDRDGNIACHYCGTYRDYTSRDAQYGAGQHRRECEWMNAHAIIQLETNQR